MAQSPISNLLPLALLLLAFLLRVYRLGEVPPGLTHDEANHGWDAINILQGVWRFYFPLNYGSEPLYNYLVALLMAAVGRHLFALRLVNVFFSLLAVAATYRWGRPVFGRQPALIAAALLAVSFWPLATGRQALRAGILPFFMVGAVICFWHICMRRELGGTLGTQGNSRTLTDRREHGRINERKTSVFLFVREKLSSPGYPYVIGFTLCLAAMFHTYLAARLVWLVFPLFLGYLALFHRSLFKQSWRPVLLGLVAAGLLTIPMFLYLRAHREADTRLEMLTGSLQAFRSGNFGPLLDNAAEGLLALFWPGQGDHFLAYNIPGRPVYDALTAFFVFVGLAVCLWRWRRPAHFFLLLWFGVGILPSLITGPEANTTRNLAALAAIYLLPAVGGYSVLRIAYSVLQKVSSIRNTQYAIRLTITLWLAIVAIISFRDYFVRWAESPEVRAAYQHTLLESLAYLESCIGDSSAQTHLRPSASICVPFSEEETAVISSVYPGPAHDPSIARVQGQQDRLNLRWVDGRYALLFPGGTAAPLVLPASTPLHPAFAAWVEPGPAVALRPDDLDPSFSLTRLVPGEWPLAAEPINLGNALQLIGWQWLPDPVAAGTTADLITIWRVTDPSLVGPIVPPAFTTDVVLFTHLLDQDGNIVAQRDALDAPSWDWQPGDVVVQLHSLFVPADTPPGLYQTAVGVYDRASGTRLPVIGANGEVVDGRAFVAPLQVVAP